jgi:hypothetical protein
MPSKEEVEEAIKAHVEQFHTSDFPSTNMQNLHRACGKPWSAHVYGMPGGTICPTGEPVVLPSFGIRLPLSQTSKGHLLNIRQSFEKNGTLTPMQIDMLLKLAGE